MHNNTKWIPIDKEKFVWSTRGVIVRKKIIGHAPNARNEWEVYSKYNEGKPQDLLFKAEALTDLMPLLNFFSEDIPFPIVDVLIPAE